MEGKKNSFSVFEGWVFLFILSNYFLSLWFRKSDAKFKSLNLRNKEAVMIVELKDIERLRSGLLGGNGVEGKMEEPSGEETKSQKPQINRQLIRNKNNKASIFFSFFFQSRPGACVNMLLLNDDSLLICHITFFKTIGVSV